MLRKLMFFFISVAGLALGGTVLSAQEKTRIFQTEKAKIKVEQVFDGLEYPWGLTMLPDGKLLVTEKPGRIRMIDPKAPESSKTVRGGPKVWYSGQGGLLDIAADPDFAQNQTIYFTFSEPAFPYGAGTAISSARFEAEPIPRLTDIKTLFSMKNKTIKGQHFGSRIVFGEDGTIFFTIGDRGKSSRAQDPFDAAGKVLRINKDGSVPTDNPFANGKKALPQIWSMGHRNPQGATLDQKTGKLWTLSHGARGGDEINKPEAGKNYGWPRISYGRHYSGGKIGVGTSAPGFEQPVYYWDPSIAPSGLDFYSGSSIPQWKDNLFAGALKDQMLVRLEIKDGKITHEERLLKGEYGRIRNVRSFGDGALWLLTDGDDGKLLRITNGN